jgi:hypothetical protein
MWEQTLNDFSGSREPVRIFYIEINGNLIFESRIFTLRTVFVERITFVNRGMSVYSIELQISLPRLVYTLLKRCIRRTGRRKGGRTARRKGGRSR